MQTMATGNDFASSPSIVVMLASPVCWWVAVVQKTREDQHPAAMGASRGQMPPGCSCCRSGLVGLFWSMQRPGLSAVLIFGFSNFVRGADGNPLFPITLTGPLLAYACVTATLCGMLAAIAPARRNGFDLALAMRMSTAGNAAADRNPGSYNIGTAVEAEILHGIISLSPVANSLR